MKIYSFSNSVWRVIRGLSNQLGPSGAHRISSGILWPALLAVLNLWRLNHLIFGKVKVWPKSVGWLKMVGSIPILIFLTLKFLKWKFWCKFFSCKCSILLQAVKLQVVYFAANSRCKWHFSLQVVATSCRCNRFCWKCAIFAANVLFNCKWPASSDPLRVTCCKW